VSLDLVVPGVSLHETEKLRARHCLYHLIHPWEGETILWASFIEVSEVDADPPPAVLLLHEDEIGEPVGVECLSDEADL